MAAYRRAVRPKTIPAIAHRSVKRFAVNFSIELSVRGA